MVVKLLFITFICANITIGKKRQAIKLSEPKNNFSLELVSVECTSIDEIVSNNTNVTTLKTFVTHCSFSDKHRGKKLYAT